MFIIILSEVAHKTRNINNKLAIKINIYKRQSQLQLKRTCYSVYMCIYIKWSRKREGWLIRIESIEFSEMSNYTV